MKAAVGSALQMSSPLNTELILIIGASCLRCIALHADFSRSLPFTGDERNRTISGTFLRHLGRACRRKYVTERGGGSEETRVFVCNVDMITSKTVLPLTNI